MKAALHPFVLVALLALSACTEDKALFNQSKDESGGTSADTGAVDGEDAELSALRLDVYPSSASGAVASQTLVVDLDDLNGRDIELQAPVTLRGTVTGYSATPPNAVEVPGEETPVVAEIHLDQKNGIADAGTTSDADGDFRLETTPGDDYIFSVVPLDPANLPFLVLPTLEVSDGLSFDKDDLDLGYGEAVYGIVARTDGTPVSAIVTLIDAETGARGPSVETDPTGYYQLRSLPGTYQLEVVGDGPQLSPTVLQDLEVLEGEGSDLDVDVGENNAVAFDAEVVDSSGDGLPLVTVRFTSIELDRPEWSLEREIKTDDRGLVNTKLLPGSWRIEIIPDYSAHLSPVSLEVDVGDEDVVLQDPVVVPGLSLISSLVLDPNDAPMSDVVVAVTEAGFNGRTWTGVTDPAGRITLEVPDVEISVAFTPPNDSAAITRLSLSDLSEMPDTVSLRAGQAILGTLVVDGEEVPFALVELRNPNSGALLGSTITGSDGSFALHLDL